MKLFVEWDRILKLKDATKEDLIYSVDLQKVLTAPGVYVFARRWGSGFEALYVGKANGIRGRVKSQLNNLRLMQHLKNAKIGGRVLLCGRIDTRPGQQLEKSLLLIERGLIRYFLSEGFDLVNKQGTRLRRHEVTASGKHPKRFVPKLMYVEKSRGD